MAEETQIGPSIRAQLGKATPVIGRFEAMILLGFVTGRTRENLIAHDDDELTDEEIMRFDLLVSLRAAGTPVPYLTGTQEFYGRHFQVTDRVLIPRPDTEVLIEQALLVAPAAPRIIDLGTGSGCIAVTLALEIPGAKVTATDSSSDALEIARGNADVLGADIRFLEGFWWDAVPADEQFDLIVSNPPYIRPDDEHLRNLEYEPLGALTDGIDGLECLRVISAGAMARLSRGGWLLLEHGYDQGADVRAMLEDAGFAAVRTIRDYGGNDRVTMGRRAD
ncbi:peptide chain release factor N(5)-glutamine methyltransferase [Sutterella sp.]|uniref:peptide chain release factor N(5)-glutamine methyltransferase n=1 Tax=Sutterella sp. TaxID=1981025 RepID=UPI0026DFDF8F|nr:peptide chain release factor N(5)-glutamine methyltransferase [Sutterella sp.]MDO5532655.1 peptide chain release factor N(5)-glutamine methyltransferase [Sutterella sp.]